MVTKSMSVSVDVYGNMNATDCQNLSERIMIE